MTKTAVASESRRFCVVQFEFPWDLGPQPGRYTIREHLGEAPEHVLVITRLDATQRHLRPRRRARARTREAPPEPPPEPVATSRAALVDTAALGDLDAAARWLAAAPLDALADAALRRLNRVLHAQRVASQDAHVREVSRAQALVVRIGFGDGERVAQGSWERARELPRARQGALRVPAAGLRSQERLAAILAGRDVALACEELTVRARLDVDAARYREAALQLRVAFEATLAELEPWREAGGLAARLDALRLRRDDVGGLANAALANGLDDAQIALLEELLGRVEAALRTRAAAARP